MCGVCLAREASESQDAMRDGPLTPGISRWDLSGAGSKIPEDGARQARTHENQMKGKLDDSLGLREEKRGGGGHKAVRECASPSPPACQMQILLTSERAVPRNSATGP